MTRLTVTEKEHWKSRIERRIEKAIDAQSALDPSFLPSLKAKAEKQTYNSLGIGEANAKLNKLKSDIASLEQQKRELETTMQSQVLGRDVDDNVYSLRCEFQTILRKRQAICEEELLAQSEIGKRILGLRAEQEELLDTVWLATSSVQIRELWEQVASLLGDEPTSLQKEALAISPECNS